VYATPSSISAHQDCHACVSLSLPELQKRNISRHSTSIWHREPATSHWPISLDVKFAFVFKARLKSELIVLRFLPDPHLFFSVPSEEQI
jgi:hypothetical protein